MRWKNPASAEVTRVELTISNATMRILTCRPLVITHLICFVRHFIVRHRGAIIPCISFALTAKLQRLWRFLDHWDHRIPRPEGPGVPRAHPDPQARSLGYHVKAFQGDHRSPVR